MTERKTTKKVGQQEATVDVTSTVLGKTKRKSKRIKIRPFVTEPAHVGVKFGTSFEAGDGKWVKVDVMLNSPCYKEEMVDVFHNLSDLGDALIDGEVERLTKEIEE